MAFVTYNDTNQRAPNRFPNDNKQEVRPSMSKNVNDDTLHALKIAFSYMPKAIEVNKYEYGDRYQTVLEHIQTVRETLLLNDIDPEEVYGEISPDSTPNSSY